MHREFAALVEVDKISFRYGRNPPLFEGLSFTVRPGDRIVISGPSGVGKSSLLRVLSGEFEPTAGLCTRRTERGKVAALHQSTPLLGRRSVLDNLLQASRARSRRERVAVSMESLDKVGLTDMSNRSAGSLSGGEVQRVCIARSFVQDASLILADEPTGQLDATSTGMVCDALLNAPNSSAVVVVTHDAMVVDRFETQIDLSAP